MEDRLIQLEERVAHQEKLLSELDEVVIAFARRVEGLERLVESSIVDQGESNERHDTPPPHY